MEYLENKEFVFQFAERAKVNLKMIEKAHEDGNTVYEVTQLIGSLMGLIVFPKERNVVIKDPSISKKLRELFGKNAKTEGKRPTLPQSLKYMRHALSHSHVFFIAGTKEINRHREIERIEFINCSYSHGKNPCKEAGKNNDCQKCRNAPRSQEKPDFVLSLTVDELRQAVDWIADDFIEQANAKKQRKTTQSI